MKTRRNTAILVALFALALTSPAHAADTLWSADGEHPRAFGPPCFSMEAAIERLNDAVKVEVIDEYAGHKVPREPVTAADLKLRPIPKDTRILKTAGRDKDKVFIDRRPKRTAGEYAGYVTYKWGPAVAVMQACSNPTLLDLPPEVPTPATQPPATEPPATIIQQTNVIVQNMVPEFVSHQRMLDDGPGWWDRHHKAVYWTGGAAVVLAVVKWVVIPAFEDETQTIVVCSGPGPC